MPLLSRMYKRVSDNDNKNSDIFRSDLQVFAKSILCEYTYVLFFIPNISDKFSNYARSLHLLTVVLK
jgi:hypothetical protein